MAQQKRSQLEAVEELYQAVLTLRSEEECRRFFKDLFTIQELSAFALRLRVARMLTEGYTYDRIHEHCAVSSGTITRINTELQYGAGGYHLVLERLNEAREAGADTADR